MSVRRSLPALAGLSLLLLWLALGVRPAASQQASLRDLDWNAVLRADPAVTILTECNQFPDLTRYPCVGVSGPIVRGRDPLGRPAVAGTALTDALLFGDLDGDGVDEAVILLDSGGTAGVIGLLIYRQGEDGPVLVAAVAGYRLGKRIEAGTLIVSEPLYFGFEGNCCPTALRYTLYSIVNGGFNSVEGGLTLAGSHERPVTLQEATVIAFYDALSQHQLAAAYTLLSPDAQAEQPLARWAAGYATTERIDVDARATADPDVIAVDLVATDRTSDGGSLVSHFRGMWRLIPNAAGDGWLLDRAEIAAVQAERRFT